MPDERSAPPLLIRGGYVIDPSRGIDGLADVWIEKGCIARVEPLAGPRGGRPGAAPREQPGLPGAEQAPGAQPGGTGAQGDAGPAAARAYGAEPAGSDAVTVWDASGLIVVPGLIDLHVHLRTPGQERKEDLASGSAAALAGGFTSVVCMANTEPPLDAPIRLRWLLDRCRERAACRVYPMGAVSKGLAGKELAPLGSLAEAGAVAFSDDGFPVLDAGLMRSALLYAREFRRPVVAHEEETSLAAGGVVHAGAVATRLGLRGMPASAEAVMIARDVLLAEETGAHLHVAHVSTAAGVAVLRWAKQRGIPVTAEVTPHHLILTEARVGEPPYDTSAKVNPPLRSEADRQACLEALADGVIDVIATDHAPHHADDKDCEFDRAAFGISGLETALGLVLSHLVEPGYLSRREAIARLSTLPARIFDLPGGTLAPGAAADLAIFDPAATWQVRPDRFRSRGRNTPFAGWTLQGRVVATVVGGRLTDFRSSWQEEGDPGE